MLRKSFRALILMLLGATLGWLAAAQRQRSPVVPDGSRSAPTIEQIQSLATLTTVRVDVADVRLTELSGYTGGVRVAAMIKGDFYLSTDLTQARFTSVDRANRTAVLVLAQPRVSSPRLDHRRTKLFALSTSGLWQVTPGEGPYAEAVNKAYAEAQAAIEVSAASAEALARARAQAEAVLGCFFRALGWEVTVRWDGG